ncbi:MAG TPA: integrase family protein [Kofleriaceae bacterium]|jgi:integrase
MQMRLTEKAVGGIVAPVDVPQSYYWDTELRGFGVVVGKTGRKTFVVRGYVGGAQHKATIGVAGQPNADGQAWTVLLARIDARQKLGQMASGTDPNAAKRRGAGPTLREGVVVHVANMRKRGRAENSIAILEAETERHLEAWLDRPIAELRGSDLVVLHDRITREAGPYVANHIAAHVSAVWNTLDRIHELDGRNPARAVTRNPYTPSRERIGADDLPGWLAKVQQLTPVRRDLRMFVLFTGMRDESARHVRWEHIDWKRSALLVPKPKGGESRAFTLPLPKTLVDMLKVRERENRDLFAPSGGDAGWVFPTVSLDGERVIPVQETKERRFNEKTGKREQFLPGMHVARRTYLSVAAEAGISELDRHVLANHAFGRQNVNATYIEQAFDHLAKCQATIEVALWARLRPPKRRTLRLFDVAHAVRRRTPRVRY